MTNDNTPPLERVMTPGDVAAALGVHVKTVSRWAEQGKLEFTRTPGGHRRFSQATIREILNGGRS